jgi:hypothetical protein
VREFSRSLYPSPEHPEGQNAQFAFAHQRASPGLACPEPKTRADLEHLPNEMRTALVLPDALSTPKYGVGAAGSFLGCHRVFQRSLLVPVLSTYR